MNRNLIARVSIAAVFGPIIIWISYQGGGWLFGMVLFLALLAAAEYLVREGFRAAEFLFWWALVTVAMLVATASGYVGPLNDSGVARRLAGELGEPFMTILVFVAVSAIVTVLGRRSPSDLFSRHSRLIWGVLYLGLLYPFVFRLGEIKGQFRGGDCLLFLFGVLWLGDTAAMGIGRWIGRRKLAPTVSPGKTIAGLVGGVAGALLVGLIMSSWKFRHLPVWHVLGIAAGASLVGQMGDLVESMWKRSLGIKDSSAIIPGHGGVLDRFDSLLFAAPFMYVYLMLLQG